MKRLKELLFLIGMIIIAFSGILWKKDFYPFGDKLLRYYDMEQQVAAMYYHLWDALHGAKSLFFDWYGAMGGNMSMTVSSYSFLSPFSLLFYFIPRERILESLPFLICIKMLVAGISMHTYLTARYRLDAIWNICLSFVYTFCGFFIVHFCFCPWLDVYAVFPLVMLGFYRLMKDRKPLLYICFLTMTLCMSYYLGAMILIYIFFLGGLYLLLMEREKEKRAEKALMLGIATLASIGCAAFCLLPAMYQTSIAARSGLKEAQSLWQSIVDIYTNTTLGDMRRWWSISNMSLCVIVISMGFIKNIKNGKENVYMILRVLIILILLPVESINLIWHFGSYVEYPIRCGFILAFALVTSAAYCLEREESIRVQIGKWRYAILTTLFIAACLVAYWLVDRSGFYRSDIFQIHKVWLGILAGMCILHILIRRLRFSWKKYFVFTIQILEIALTSYLLMGEENLVVQTKESQVAFVNTVNQIREELPIQGDVTNRIKNDDATLNVNYPFVMGRSALSQWTNGVSMNTQKYAEKWGYTIQFTRVTDYGGTVFSDALLRITQTISTISHENSSYRKIDSMGEYGLYNNNYQLPFGIQIAMLDGKETFEDMDYVELQNAMYRILLEELPADETLLHTLVKNGSAQGDGVEITTEKEQCRICFQASESGVIYLKAGKDSKGFQISLNGKAVPVPEMNDRDNLLYPAEFNNNVVCLGEIEAGKQEIILTGIEKSEVDICNDELSVSYLNRKYMERLCKKFENQRTDVDVKKRGMVITTESVRETGRGLLIPIPFDKGFHASVNNQEKELISVAGLFMEVPLDTGVNKIMLTYRPPYMLTGIWISIGSVIFLLGMILMNGRKKELPARLYQAVYLFYIGLFAFCVVVVYIVPVFVLPYAIYINR